MHRQILSALCLLAIGIAGTTIAGIQGSGFRAMTAVGRIVRIDGAVIVNGVEYSSAQAHVTVDGSTADQSQLHSGDIVTVNGSLSTDGTEAIADEISYVGNVRGIVTARDAQARTLTVLSQTVRLNDETVIDGDSAAAEVPLGSAVEVSGFTNAAGDLIASRVEVQSHAPKGQVRGTVAALDTNARTFLINSLLVDYGSAHVGGDLAEGAIVVVESKSAQAAGVLVAKSVDVSQGLGLSGQHGDLAGIITSFASDAEFELNGQRVAADEHTDYVLRGGALGPDVEVRVSGRFEVGVLRADKIEVTKKAAKAQAKASRQKEPPQKK